MTLFLPSFLTYYRAIIVAVVASGVDLGLMFGLNKTDLDDNVAIVISSMAGITIQFFGQKLWTFRNSTSTNKALAFQILQFFMLEITILVATILIFNALIKPIQKAIGQAHPKHAKSPVIKHVLEVDEKKKLRLNAAGKTLLKAIMVFITFNVISYPIWRFKIFKSK